jgi:hypothetical protein
VPNQAFLHSRADDKFWAASKLIELTTADLRAAVRAGDFRDPQSEAFLVRALAERRDAIGRAYLTAINPIVEPTLEKGGMLSFRNAAVDADFAKAPAGYRAEWFRFDNATRDDVRLGESSGRTTRIAAPAALPTDEGAYLHLKLRSVNSANASWAKPIDVFFRLQQGQWRLVGLERTAS